MTPPHIANRSSRQVSHIQIPQTNKPQHTARITKSHDWRIEETRIEKQYNQQDNKPKPQHAGKKQ